MVEYAILYVLAFRSAGSHFFSLLLVILYGISDEYHQSFVVGRESNYLRDVSFDTLGGIIAGVSIWKWSRTTRPRRKN